MRHTTAPPAFVFFGGGEAGRARTTGCGLFDFDQGKTVGIGDAADFILPSKCRLHILVFFVAVIGLLIF